MLLADTGFHCLSSTEIAVVFWAEPLHAIRARIELLQFRYTALHFCPFMLIFFNSSSLLCHIFMLLQHSAHLYKLRRFSHSLSVGLFSLSFLTLTQAVCLSLSSRSLVPSFSSSLSATVSFYLLSLSVSLLLSLSLSLCQFISLLTHSVCLVRSCR